MVIITKWIVKITKFESISNCFIQYVYLDEICKSVKITKYDSKCN